MSASPLASFASEPSRLIGLRLIPTIETFPRVAAFTQIPAGKLAVGGAFVLGYGCLLPPPGVWPLITFSIGLITFLLTLRWKTLALARLANSAVQPGSLHCCGSGVPAGSVARSGTFSFSGHLFGVNF